LLYNAFICWQIVIANKFTKLTLDTPRYFLWDLCPA